MGSNINDLAVVHHYNLVSTLNGRQSVSDYHNSATHHCVFDGLLDLVFGFGVKGASGLVKQQNSAVRKQSPGNGNALFLSTAKSDTSLSNHGIVAIGPRGNEVVGVRVSADVFELFLRDVSSSFLGQPVR